MFTLHGAIMVFLFIIPSVPAALGNFVLPLMLGAKDVAFPRLNLASFYLWVTGALMAICVHGPGRGRHRLDLLHAVFDHHRRPGDADDDGGLRARVSRRSSPASTSSPRCTSCARRAWAGSTCRCSCGASIPPRIIQILATPVLGITLVLLMLERFFGIGIFDPRIGGDPVLFQHFFWFYSHPAVYIMILPGMAIISELIPTFSRKTIFGYRAIAYSSVSLALVSFIVWGHHMFVAGQSQLATVIFSALTFLVAIPSGVKMFNWLGTMYEGNISLETPMLYAIAFLVLFAIGGLTGIFLGTLSTDVHLTDTYFVVAHFHLRDDGRNRDSPSWEGCITGGRR